MITLKNLKKGLGSTPFKRLKQPRFIHVEFFETPESAAYWVGTAAQIGGNSLYGDMILLKNLTMDEITKDIHKVGTRITAAEWEWNGGIDLEGEELEKAKELYKKYLTGGKLNED